MNLVKSIVAGLIAGLVMFVVLTVGIHTGVAPFNTAPSGAFLATFGFSSKPLALLFHFGYAAAGSILLATLFGSQVDTSRGVGLALALWLVLMVVFSPIVGWGFFGVGGPNHALPEDSPLYIGLAAKYIMITLVLHVVYGIIIGKLNQAWMPTTGKKAGGTEIT